MAKRTLGLGKAAKQRKKQKPDTEAVETKSNEIEVELDDELDPDDELNQLKGLWNTYIKSNKENELVLNGIIHESDLLLRNQTDEKKLPAEFHSLYALALAELAIFQNESINYDEEDEEKIKKLEKEIELKIKEFFDAALERIELGQSQYPESIELHFTKARILLNRIPLEFISKFDLNSKKNESIPEISKLLDQVLENYENAENSIKLLENYSLLNENVFETLKAFDDLLDIVQNFGKSDELKEGLDSDNEDEEEVQLSKSHPLYKVYTSDKYLNWLIDHSKIFGELITKEYNHLLNKDTDKLSNKEKTQLEYFQKVSLKIGQILLQAAEKPSNIFTTITYESDMDEDTKIEGYSAKEAQTEAIELTKKAVEFFKQAEDEEDPQTWVDYAEAVISLGNLYDYESKDQTEAYAVAEKKLKRANKATNGKHQRILDNLLQG